MLLHFQNSDFFFFLPKTSPQSGTLAQLRSVGIALVTSMNPGFSFAVFNFCDYSQRTTQEREINFEITL